MKKLQDEFDNGEAEHFSYYDYILQCGINGNWTSLKETLKELSNESILRLFTNNQNELRTVGVNCVEDEILKRMNHV